MLPSMEYDVVPTVSTSVVAIVINIEPENIQIKDEIRSKCTSVHVLIILNSY